MKAVIMAGGLGTRLKPITHIIPKPLLPVGEQSILEIMIQKLKSHGFTDIIIATNYKFDLFESYFGDGSKFGVKITYSRETKKLGTAGPLKLIQGKLTEPFLVMNGDILTNLNFTELKDFHIENNADMTIVTKEIQLPLHYGVVESKEAVVVNIQEKPIIKSEIVAGIYFLNPCVLNHITEEFYNMTDLMKDLIEKEKRVLKHKLKDYWIDIGQMDDYKKAQDDAKNGHLNL